MPGEIENPRVRVLLDSNVIISGFTHGGTPRAILDLLWAEELECYISLFITAEVSNCLRADFGWADLAVERAMAALRTHCVLLDPPPEAALPQLSSADNRILDCAVYGQARYLVTGDKGIQRVESFQGIEIVSPAAFLQGYREMNLRF